MTYIYWAEATDTVGFVDKYDVWDLELYGKKREEGGRKEKRREGREGGREKVREIYNDYY